MVTHTWHTHAHRDGPTPSCSSVSGLSAAPQRIRRPERNKQTCHFPFSSKTECLSVIFMCHFLSMGERRQNGFMGTAEQRSREGKQYIFNTSSFLVSIFPHGYHAVTANWFIYLNSFLLGWGFRGVWFYCTLDKELFVFPPPAISALYLS